jgi:two-component system sensor histidine kinase/response regulator
MTPERVGLLYVDDEENNLISFQANFRKEYTVYLAASAAEAFTVLENNPIHIIISDQRMPNITGIEFLEQTIDKYPDSIRLLITGQSDIEIVIEAINRGQITKYIQKPWDWDKLALVIENCEHLYQSRRELKLKNEQLQKANDELNKFVYSVSHDLRSPLMSILGIVQLAKSSDDKKLSEDYIQIIESCVNKLDSFIKNIIDYYRNSKSDALIEDIDFNWLIKDVVDTLKNQDSTIKFESEIEQTTVFAGDLFRLRVILNNLVSNAIKYQNPQAKQHFIKLHVMVKDPIARITISDNGVGILQEHIENIFKLFFRTQNTQHQQGSGIGLYIVKEAIEKMNGTIQVYSTPLIGTSFEVIIPNQEKKHE